MTFIILSRKRTVKAVLFEKHKGGIDNEKLVGEFLRGASKSGSMGS